MLRNIDITASPIDSSEGDVQLTGNFRWEFDAAGEKLLNCSAENLFLSREQYLADTGVLYKFSWSIQDLTEKGAFEVNVGNSRGLRDTAHLVVRLVSRHNDGQGMVNNILATAELREMGSRYYIPPLP